MLYLVFPGPDPPSGRRFSRCAEDKSGVFAKNNLPNFPPPRITCRVDADSVFRLPSPERRSNGGNRRAASPLAVGGNRGERNAPRRAAAPGMVFADRRDPFADWSGSDKDRCTPSVFAALRRRRLPRGGRLAKAAGTRVDSCLAAARSGAALPCRRHGIHSRVPASQPRGQCRPLKAGTIKSPSLRDRKAVAAIRFSSLLRHEREQDGNTDRHSQCTHWLRDDSKGRLGA